MFNIKRHLTGHERMQIIHVDLHITTELLCVLSYLRVLTDIDPPLLFRDEEEMARRTGAAAGILSLFGDCSRCSAPGTSSFSKLPGPRLLSNAALGRNGGMMGVCKSGCSLPAIRSFACSNDRQYFTNACDDLNM